MKKMISKEPMISLISYYPPWENGRVLRAYNSLRSNYNTTLITSGTSIPDEYLEENIIILGTNFTGGIFLYFYILFKFLAKLQSLKSGVTIYFDYYTAPKHFLSIHKKKLGYVIYDMFEYYPRKEDMTLREIFFNFFERHIILRANKVTVANEIRSFLTRQTYGLGYDPIFIGNFGFTNHNLRKYSNNLDFKKIKIVYMGNLSNERRLIEFSKVVSKHDKDYEFHIYGTGPMRYQLEELLNSGSISNVFLHKKYNQGEMAGILGQMDIGYLYYPNSDDNNKFCAPLKIHDYASAGLVMISYYNFTLNSIFNEYDIGLSTDNIELALFELSDKLEDKREKLNCYLIENNYLNEKVKLIEIVEEGLNEKN